MADGIRAGTVLSVGTQVLEGQRVDQDWGQDSVHGTTPIHDPHVLLCDPKGQRSMGMRPKHLLD